MRVVCPQCSQTADKPASAVNRARRRGAPIYCSRECSDFGRRKNKTIDQKRQEKRLYDMEYRARNDIALKAKKAAYHKRTYDPVEAAIKRRSRMAQHVEYCRRPAYRKKKKAYDQVYSCLLYTSPSPRDQRGSRMPSSA